MKGQTMIVIILIAVAVTASFLLLTYLPTDEEQSSSSPSGGYAKEYLLVDPDWVEMHSKDVDVRIVDVRDEASYEVGHIPGAVNIHFREFQETYLGILRVAVSVEKFEDIVSEAGITPKTTVVLYDFSDNLDASQVFWVFEYYGHKTVRLLNGGFQLWASEGQTVDQEDTVVEKTEYSVTSVLENKIANAEWIMENLNAEDVKILDVRSELEYTGEVQNTKRGGHIPGAVNVEWVDTVNPDGTFKSADVLLDMYRDVGVTQDKEVVVYCQSGHRASHGYFTLRLLGYPEVRVYDRSWLEWGNRSDLPVEE